jgi:hypothetical protein
MSTSASVPTDAQRQQWQQEWEELSKEADGSLKEALPKIDELVERMLTAHGYPVAAEEEKASAAGYIPDDDSSDVLEDFFQSRAMVRVLDSRFPPTETAKRKTFEGYEHLYTWLMKQA